MLIEARELITGSQAEQDRPGIAKGRLDHDAGFRLAGGLHVPGVEVEGAVLRVLAGHHVGEEVTDLVAGDREADAGVHPSAIADGDATVDADHEAGLVEQRTTGVAGVHRSVHLDAVGVDQHAIALARLVAVGA